ncbi:ribonuclease P/MRP protein subunit POP6 NDAI_0D03950 [Naumovozyma dairenensis CBS 421]|uniref:DNA/RNA-binding protein Alba-like domain-containing protein n=1 Tax=Naumovozyma dairenensis (strain ATCC 10597 / BCRC 20456 / CBS 421 / NBRC 0211 / NRRL Y-12639) TaxID=1071378 RepID=G0WA98_NAUDC|nr:hypothetical protein NDAI_0D03950 [Naumovozyma dairenensis CBS 421]CCD24709.1 hypothetical protein NDAI_0D03950 [Naumovozyma dairenensis CBS 421]
MKTARVQYKRNETDLDISTQTQCFQFIQEKIIPDLLNLNADFDRSKINYFKISKNDNIKQKVEKLQTVTSGECVCAYAYGPHLQKMLSILEICKNVVKKNDLEGSISQWNHLTCFELVQEGRNELLEKKINVPILISVITANSALASSIEFNTNKWTKQS